jgi:hypothetical protein
MDFPSSVAYDPAFWVAIRPGKENSFALFHRASTGNPAVRCIVTKPFS